MKITRKIGQALVGGGVIFLLPFALVGNATAQTCVQPPAGLVSWWPGDGDVEDIQDSNHGTLQNGATFAPGTVASAFNFDGVDDHVLIPDSPSLNPQRAISLLAWVYRCIQPPHLQMGETSSLIGNIYSSTARARYSVLILAFLTDVQAPRESGSILARMAIGRVTRLVNAFSKKWDNPKAALALHFAHYDFCRVHCTLRVTPAMEPGITTHI
jgi:hypothetical protein